MVDKSTRVIASIDTESVHKLSVEQRAYIAGYFDGEGSVGLYPKKAGFALKVTVVQRKPEVLLWLHGLFGGALVTVDRTEARGNIYYELRLEGPDAALPLLKVIAPYVREKKDQIDLVISHYDGEWKIGMDEVEQLQRKHNVVSLLKGMKRA